MIVPSILRAPLEAGAAENKRWEGLPPGTRLGPMHLRVGDIERARDFYRGVLGFAIMAQMSEALFVSAGGYHHHIGKNISESKGASAPPEHMAGLRFFTVDLPNEEAPEAVVDRVTAAGLSAERTAEGAAVWDPWRTRIVLRPNAAQDSESAAALASSM